MRFVNRFRLSVQSRVETFLDRIENHEAAAEAVLRESREALARCEVRAERLRRQGEMLSKRYDEARDQAEKWQKRAAELAEKDRTRAVECLRRKQSAQKEADELEKDLSAHRELEDKLSQDLRRARRNVDELARKRNSLAARENCARATNETGRLECDGEADRIFERWEERVRASELEDGALGEGRDSFSRRFDDEEERAALEAELDELTRNEK